MRSRGFIIGIVILVLLIVGIIAATLVLTPAENPAFATAIDFVEAVSADDNIAAGRLLSGQMADWVADNCSGFVVQCVNRYIPAEWGEFSSVVFRRATPDGTAWDVELIATYEEGFGFSGVCIYTRVEESALIGWMISGWAGWISCGDPASREMMNRPDAPNRAP